MKHWSNNSALSIYDISYDELISRPEDKIKELINFIDVDWNESCLEHHKSKRTIMTPSYDQASKPIYKDSLNRWKNYEKHLSPLIEVLGNPDSVN